MRRALVSLVFSLLLASCGNDPPPVGQLTLASSYDLIGVRRDFPDGLTVERHAPVTLILDGIAVSGGLARGRLLRNETSAPIELDGTFDASDGRLIFGATSGAVWSEKVETLDGIGGTAVDGTPRDGLANEIVGFVQTSTGSAQYEASFLAVARSDDRPARLDDSRITVELVGLGEVRVVGSAGTAPGSAGIEVFRHELIEREGEFSLHQAMDDGAFAITVPAFEGDLLLLRARVAGRAGPGISVAVPGE